MWVHLVLIPGHNTYMHKRVHQLRHSSFITENQNLYFVGRWKNVWHVRERCGSAVLTVPTPTLRQGTLLRASSGHRTSSPILPFSPSCQRPYSLYYQFLLSTGTRFHILPLFPCGRLFIFDLNSFHILLRFSRYLWFTFSL